MRLCMNRIQDAAAELAPPFSQTPQYECEPLSASLGCAITLKVETLNPIRSFKGRGTQIAVSRALEAGFESVICASAGNLGQAVAYFARERGMTATVIASRSANKAKLQRISELGATLQRVDGDIEQARQLAVQIAAADGSHLIEDSENLGTCEGAATIGLELTGENARGTLDAVLIALGGGALATGVGFVVKQRSPATQVICVQPAGAPAMTRSWRARKVVPGETIATIADGVAGRFPIAEVLDDLLIVADDALLVEEATIVRGMRLLYEQAGLISEPSAALGIAAVLENRSRFAGQRIASILCGSNVCLDQFHQWISPEGGLARGP